MEAVSVPFSKREHRAFLEALENCANHSDTATWTQIAEAIGTRTPAEVQIHAHWYFLQLQGHGASEPAARSGSSGGNNNGSSGLAAAGLGVLDDGTWSAEEDLVFESALAAVGEGDPERWERIASIMPGREPTDVRRRYQRLFYDVSQIEMGNPVTMRYRPAGVPLQPPSLNTASETGEPQALRQLPGFGAGLPAAEGDTSESASGQERQQRQQQQFQSSSGAAGAPREPPIGPP